MCTFGVTIHPSRLFFIGETTFESRLPIYNVIPGELQQSISRSQSMQKLARGLSLVVEKISESDEKNDIKWIVVMDDDTFISPPNLNILVSQYDSQHLLIIGQSTCGIGFCGGAGYVISRGVFRQFPSFIHKCRPLPGIAESDQFIPLCIKNRTKVEFVNRKEFNSQPPEFYSTDFGYKDHPDGFGQAVSFHYIRPGEKYVALWRLHQAFMKPC
ncbi:unnamed protein product [Adineta ricciae]|nr:unnamed protein product [Adineta ricciae]